ncbi:MAG: hypothetical protein CVV33_00035 [Methanomicrobiales archaeon HGW-Methanomicrobiales-4]|nr:MAG: hypothetical protein CVV33_00035 [Methanomicrobiales archaeon HGW-Methanomicrobiales-4]
MNEKDTLTEIRISADPMLLTMLDEAAGLMEIRREDLVMKILKLWEKNQTMPLHGTDILCQIDPSSID